jgi:hypothetical protein
MQGMAIERQYFNNAQKRFNPNRQITLITDSMLTQWLYQPPRLRIESVAIPNPDSSVLIKNTGTSSGKIAILEAALKIQSCSTPAQ